MQKRLKDYDFFHTYKKWHNGCGAFECFVHSTCFVSLKHYPDFELRNVSTDNYCVPDKVECTIRQYGTSHVLYFVDLPTTSTLNMAFLLDSQYYLKPILTIRHMEHPFGIVGGQECISCLLQYGERLREEANNGNVFILDSLRYDDHEDNQYKTHFNNQYELSEFDLPPFELLKAMGYETLVLFYQELIKEDTMQYFEYIQSQGMDFVKVMI